VFFDTFVICTCTALLILLSGFYTPGFGGDGLVLTQDALAAGGLLALVNLVALALLGKVVLRLIDDYDRQRKAGVQIPVFDASQFRDLDLDPLAWPEGDQVAAEGGSETRMPQVF